MNHQPLANRFGSAIVTLPTDTQIKIVRVFDAPAAAVFEAWTSPTLVRRWWGSDEHPLTVCDIDLRVGGDWRYAMTMDGVDLGWHGTYREVAGPHRLVSTEVFEGAPQAEAVNTLTLDEREGATTVTVMVQHATRANRDGHVESGMEAGMQQTFDRLETLITASAVGVVSRVAADAPDEPQRRTPVSEVATRWRTIAGTFTDRTRAVGDDAWANASPCEQWTARDIVGHLVDWVPPFLDAGAGITIDGIPAVDTDPAGAWARLDEQIRAVLDADDIGDRMFDHPFAGRHPLDVAIERFVLGDVLIHTWDLSRATGQDERLDPAMVASMLDGVIAMGDALQQSGHYGPPVEVAAGADNQTKLLALTGRQP